ncbi:hypothetical protein F5146DRAFT_1140075 [Armillaria mellea]|nr:hypothetical protein F5146DRAFT_1140075 [Armillaria mellea]
MINNNNPELFQTTSSHLAIAIAIGTGRIRSYKEHHCSGIILGVSFNDTFRARIPPHGCYGQGRAAKHIEILNDGGPVLIKCDNVIADHKKSGAKKHFSPAPGHMKKEIRRLAQTAKAEVKPFARRMSSSFQIAFSPMASPFTPSSDAYFPRKASVQLKHFGTIVEEAVMTSQETAIVASRKTKRAAVLIKKTKTTKKFVKVGKKVKRVFLESVYEVFRSPSS